MLTNAKLEDFYESALAALTKTIGDPPAAGELKEITRATGDRLVQVLIGRAIANVTSRSAVLQAFIANIKE